MKFTCFWIFTSLVLLTYCLKAAEGCAIGSQLYTVETTPVVGVTIAADLKVYRQPGNSCYTGTISTAKACFVCENGGEVTIVLGVTPALYVVTCGNRYFLDVGYLAARGTYYSNYVLQCDLDDYTWLFGASAAAVGLVIIRRKY